jgi:hypothetical protein
MNKSVNSKIGFAALAVMLIFGVIASAPQIASAYYTGSYIGNRYGYDTSPTIIRPVYVSQPVYYTQPVIVQQPVYVSQPVVVQQYQPLTSSCSATVSYNISGQATVVYTANPVGGNGYYSYSWTGTEDFSGSHRSVSKTYYTSGYKYASVTISSNGYTTTVSCNPVNITFPYNTYYQPVYQQPVYQNINQPVYVNSNSLDIGCFVDPTNAKVNQPINWTAEVSGGVAPYTYSWTGSDGLTGTQSSVIKYYSTTGSKSAVVSVTSADGKVGTKACSNAITIASAYKAPVAAKVTKTAPVAVVSQPAVTSQPVVANAPTNSNMTANAILSLGNVPWGWVAVVIILVLFFTVMYLLFNKKKI